MTNSKKKKEIIEAEYYNIASYLDGSIDEVIDYMNSIKKEGWNKLKVKFVESSSNEFGYAIYPQQTRLETDEEFKSRIKREKALKTIEKAKRFNMFQILKKEFGDTPIE